MAPINTHTCTYKLYMYRSNWLPKKTNFKPDTKILPELYIHMYMYILKIHVISFIADTFHKGQLISDDNQNNERQ